MSPGDMITYILSIAGCAIWFLYQRQGWDRAILYYISRAVVLPWDIAIPCDNRDKHAFITRTDLNTSRFRRDHHLRAMNKLLTRIY